MRLVATLLNCGLLTFAAWAVAEGGRPKWSAIEWLLLALFVLTPLASFYVMHRSAPRSKGWFSLFLERKALEERKRIEELNGAGGRRSD